MKNLRLVLAACAVLSAACGGMKAAKTQKTEFGDNTPKVESLAGKSTAEVLKLKYKRAEVVCRAFKGQTPYNIVRFDQVKPTVDHRINLLDQRDLQKVDSVRIPLPRIDNYQAEARISVVGVSISYQLTHVDEAGNVYEMQYTPKVKLEYTFDHFITPALRASELGGWELSENTPPQQFLSTSADQSLLDQGQHHAHGLSCSIETEIKPEYQDQFKVKKKK